jgi:hypothetical protein
MQSTLNEGIATFYDESSELWESMWGEHMHHGYYPKNASPKSNQEAQIDMIEEVLKWAGATRATKVRQRPAITSHLHFLCLCISMRERVNLHEMHKQCCCNSHAAAGMVTALQAVLCKPVPSGILSMQCRWWMWAVALAAAADTYPGNLGAQHRALP